MHCERKVNIIPPARSEAAPVTVGARRSVRAVCRETRADPEAVAEGNILAAKVKVVAVILSSEDLTGRKKIRL